MAEFVRLRGECNYKPCNLGRGIKLRFYYSGAFLPPQPTHKWYHKCACSHKTQPKKRAKRRSINIHNSHKCIVMCLEKRCINIIRLAPANEARVFLLVVCSLALFLCLSLVFFWVHHIALPHCAAGIMCKRISSVIQTTISPSLTKM